MKEIKKLTELNKTNQNLLTNSKRIYHVGKYRDVYFRFNNRVSNFLCEILSYFEKIYYHNFEWVS